MKAEMMVGLVVLILGSHAWAASPKPLTIEALRARVAALEKENAALKETVRVQGAQITALQAQLKRLGDMKPVVAKAPPQATPAPLAATVGPSPTLDSDAYWTPAEHMIPIPGSDKHVICAVVTQITGMSVAGTPSICNREQELGILKADPESNSRIRSRVTSIWQGCCITGNWPGPEHSISPEQAFAKVSTREDKTTLGKVLIKMYVSWLAHADQPGADNAETCHARLAALATQYGLEAIRDTWASLTIARAKELWAQRLRPTHWTHP